VIYTNRQYHFRFDLPQSWQGFTVLSEEWSGRADNPNQTLPTETGPEIILRHPLWTEAHPRQDIPIMIFTTRQWNENLVVSAAPIGPLELGRNSRFVFALPARYNFAFLDGYEEVESILRHRPLHAY
jgi:hypothetical protein